MLIRITSRPLRTVPVVTIVERPPAAVNRRGRPPESQQDHAVSARWYLSVYAGGAAGRAGNGHDAARHFDPVGEPAQAAGIGQ